MDLFELAAAAEPQLDQRYRDRFGGLPAGGAHDALRDQVGEDGRVSVNLKPAALKTFLVSGRYLNIFDVAAERSVASGRSLDQELRGLLKGWYSKRIRFELRLAGGRHFYYGALNIGGLGCPRYGRFCAVLTRRAHASELRLAFLEGDSLSHPSLRDGRGRLLTRRLQARLATPGRVGHLSALKHADELGCASAGWAELLCNDNAYVEAAFTDAPTVGGVQEVRFSRVEDQRLQDAALWGVATGKAGTSDLDLTLYQELRDGLDRNGINFKVVDP